MAHWSNRAGWGLLIASYLVQSAMILWGPPPVKAAGVWFAGQPGMDPFVYGVGAWMAKDWGHGDDVASIATFEQEATKESYEWLGGYCDPDDPPWWC